MAKKPTNRSSMSGLARPKSNTLDGPDNWIKPEAEAPRPEPKAQPAAEPARAKPAPVKKEPVAPAPRPSTAPPPVGDVQQARHALTLRLTSDVYERLRDFAHPRRMKHQQVLENALTEYLDKYEE